MAPEPARRFVPDVPAGPWHPPSLRRVAPTARGTGSPLPPLPSREPLAGLRDTAVPQGGRGGAGGGGIHRVAGACGALPSAPCPQVYVLKRPHVDEFLQRMGELFECVLFTASLAKVGAPPPPATAIALPFPATPRVAQLPLAAHLWASVAPRPLRACRQCLPLPGAGQGN